MFDEQVTVATLNTQGVPVVGTHLAGRFAVIGAEVEAGDADVACFQEVFTWWHLRSLVLTEVDRAVLERPAGWAPGAGTTVRSEK